MIRRSEFLDLLSDYPDDYEKFAYIKDQVIQDNNFQLIGAKCICCDSFYHDIYKCRLIHFIPDTYKIAKTYYQDDKVQLRTRSYKRKTRIKYRALTDLVLVCELGLQVLSDHQDYIQSRHWLLCDASASQISSSSNTDDYFDEPTSSDVDIYNEVIEEENYTSQDELKSPKLPKSVKKLGQRMALSKMDDIIKEKQSKGSQDSIKLQLNAMKSSKRSQNSDSSQKSPLSVLQNRLKKASSRSTKHVRIQKKRHTEKIDMGQRFKKQNMLSSKMSRSLYPMNKSTQPAKHYFSPTINEPTSQKNLSDMEYLDTINMELSQQVPFKQAQQLIQKHDFRKYGEISRPKIVIKQADDGDTDKQEKNENEEKEQKIDEGYNSDNSDSSVQEKSPSSSVPSYESRIIEPSQINIIDEVRERNKSISTEKDTTERNSSVKRQRDRTNGIISIIHQNQKFDFAHDTDSTTTKSPSSQKQNLALQSNILATKLRNIKSSPKKKDSYDMKESNNLEINDNKMMLSTQVQQQMKKKSFNRPVSSKKTGYSLFPNTTKMEVSATSSVRKKNNSIKIDGQNLGHRRSTIFQNIPPKVDLTAITSLMEESKYSGYKTTKSRSSNQQYEGFSDLAKSQFKRDKNVTPLNLLNQSKGPNNQIQLTLNNLQNEIKTLMDKLHNPVEEIERSIMYQEDIFELDKLKNYYIYYPHYNVDKILGKLDLFQEQQKKKKKKKKLTRTRNHQKTSTGKLTPSVSVTTQKPRRMSQFKEFNKDSTFPLMMSPNVQARRTIQNVFTFQHPLPSKNNRQSQFTNNSTTNQSDVEADLLTTERLQINTDRNLLSERNQTEEKPEKVALNINLPNTFSQQESDAKFNLASEVVASSRELD